MGGFIVDREKYELGSSTSLPKIRGVGGFRFRGRISESGLLPRVCFIPSFDVRCAELGVGVMGTDQSS